MKNRLRSVRDHLSKARVATEGRGNSPMIHRPTAPSGKEATDQDRLKALAAEVGGDWREHEYYARAEEDDWIQTFWREESPFRSLLTLCEPSVALEIACGHGRHTYQLLSEYPECVVTAQDINQENIDSVKGRFEGDSRVSPLLGNGYDLTPLRDESFTLVFSYDAMVHFDDEVVFSYLQEIVRVLKPGGRALLHHSNWTGTPGGSHRDNRGWRNFMSHIWVAHGAQKLGLNVVQQVVIPWADCVALDAISLLEKPI